MSSKLNSKTIEIHSPNPSDSDDPPDECCVCQGTSGLIVYCGKCNVATHPECYGYPLVDSNHEPKVPEDDWICEQCRVHCRFARARALCCFLRCMGYRVTVVCVCVCVCALCSERCVLCPNGGRGLKRTTDWRWVHLSCASWVPEVFFRGVDGAEPLDITQVPQSRFMKVCTYSSIEIDVAAPHTVVHVLSCFLVRLAGVYLLQQETWSLFGLL
jgi:NuA3 HAT complex component NTO1